MPGDVVSRAERLHRLALGHAYRGRYDLSARRLRSALDLLADDGQDADGRRVRIRLLVLLAGVEYEVAGAQHGRAHLDEAVQISQQIGAHDLAFVVDQTLALRALRAGDTAQALQHFSAAEASMSAAADLDVCKMLLNRGNLHLQELRLDLAKADLEACLRRAEGKPELVTLAAMARHNLGYAEFLGGNLPAALRAMDEAAALSGGGASRAVGLLDRARVLTAAGLVDAADHALREAAEDFRRGRMWADLAETELARSDCALLLGNYAAARHLAGSARNRFHRRGNDRWRRQAELSLLAGDLAGGRPARRLVGPALRLAEEFAANQLPTYAKAASLIACEAELAMGDGEAAQQTLAGLPDPAPTDVLVLRLQQRTVRARLALLQSNRATARREIDHGLDELARHQAQFGSIDLQTASALHGRRLAALDVRLALETGRPASVFAALERGRAISHRLVPVTPPHNESAPLLSEVRHLAETLRQIGADPQLTVQAQATRERIAALQEQLQALAWRAQGSGAVGERASLAAVQSVLRDRGKEMVLYGRARGELFAVVVGARTRLVPLPAAGAASAMVSRIRADLNVLAYPSLPLELRQTASASAGRTLTQLDELLLSPLGILPDRPLVVVPTADLATLPWNLLPSLDGLPVEVARTATAWRHGATAPRPDTVSVTAFAGPGLPASEREVAAVARLWDRSTTFSGEHATRRALAESVSSVTVAHVATHGAHVGQNPLFSSLQLADGPLYAYELDSDHVPPHVVLSACELGQVTVRAGEESLGLTSVLLQLGVQCVISGVSEVNDEVAADVMIDYHQRLASGNDAAAALAGAITTASQPRGRDGRPAYVPFVCFGASWSR